MEGKVTSTAGAVGYLGPGGTHSEEAARRLYPDNTRQLRPYPRIDAVIRAVTDGEIDEGLVPIENSLEGSVTITLDTLAHDVELVIAGEIVWPVKHQLLAKPGTKTIKEVISHMQALAQCREYLAASYPEAEQKAAASTALAAQMVASGTGESAAIGSAAAAQVYGLEVIAAEIQDYDHNMTRFIVIKRQPAAPGPGEWKTSLAFKINGERPGSLCEVLHEFASRGVNMIRIESRPARTGLGVYIFFIDIEGSLAEQSVGEAFEAVKAKALWFKNLGSYPVLLKG